MFLFRDDYNVLITPEDYNEVTNNDDSLRLLTEVTAQEFVSMYIRQRYDVVKVFKAWATWAIGTTYAIGDYFKYTENVFSATATYSASDRVSYGGFIYSAKAAISTAHAWDITKWNLICNDNLVYTCKVISTGNRPDNTTYFTQSDPRNAEIVSIMINIVLYRIHSQIVPNNIPELRRIFFNSDGQPRKMDGSAVGTLMGIQNGDIMLELPIYVDDQQGQNITWGGNMKRNNSY
jgi:hypothetical protein